MPPRERLPVLAWIHGGGFMQDSINMPIYDGRYLCNVTNTVVVLINYRLGEFRVLPFVG